MTNRANNRYVVCCACDDGLNFSIQNLTEIDALYVSGQCAGWVHMASRVVVVLDRGDTVDVIYDKTHRYAHLMPGHERQSARLDEAIKTRSWR